MTVRADETVVALLLVLRIPVYVIDFERHGFTHPLSVATDFAPVTTFLKEDAFLDAVVFGPFESSDLETHLSKVLHRRSPTRNRTSMTGF